MATCGWAYQHSDAGIVDELFCRTNGGNFWRGSPAEGGRGGGDIRLSSLPEATGDLLSIGRIHGRGLADCSIAFTQAFGRSFSRLGASSIGPGTSRSGPVA